MAKLKQHFSSSNWHDWLDGQGLLEFDAWWGLDLELVEEGNFDRGGWSSVFRFDREGKAFYVKRQSNRNSHSVASFPFKVPTFKVEFDQIKRYNKANVPSLDLVYFAWQKADGCDRAILVTEALEGYTPLDEILNTNQPPDIKQKIALSQAIGRTVAKMHEAGIEHYNLYPKHIFIRLSDYDVRFIDLETSRANLGLQFRKLRDLETLSRRTIWANRSDKLRALLAYMGKRRVDAECRKALLTINRRTLDKLARD